MRFFIKSATMSRYVIKIPHKFQAHLKPLLKIMLKPLEAHWKAEFAARRSNVFAKMLPNSMMFVPGANVLQRNDDVEYPFRQNSDFFYLTGFKEPHSALILLKEKDHTQAILFVEAQSKEQAIWVGEKLRPEQVPDQLGLDEGWPLQALDQKAIEYILSLEKPVFYLNFGFDTAWDHRIHNVWFEQARQKKRKCQTPIYEAIYNAKAILQTQRLFKSTLELSHLQKAADLSTAAHLDLMQSTRPGLYEYELAAQFAHHAHQKGHELAYPSIVAAGKNACTLHYTKNNDLLKNGELLLVDAGIEYEYYASDITRTYPIGTSFSAPQKAIYELVLEAQQRALQELRPGLPWSSIQATIVKTLVQGLVDLHLLKGSLDALIETRAYLPYYMHSSGHWLGLDVHDAGVYQIDGKPLCLEPNMVLTVEPGLYFHPDHPHVPGPYKGIGIRIEDDVLITAAGMTLLNAQLPKQLTDVEALRQ